MAREVDSSPFLAADARKLLALIAGIVAPATLLTALAYYFGWRRERAFAGYFGIDPSVLGFSTSDYVLRSVDALFVPVSVVLLVSFGLVCLYLLVARDLERVNPAPVFAASGIGALVVGIALAGGHPISSDFIYLQALGPGVGVALIVLALAHWTGAGRARAPAAYLGTALVLVSLFWATAEYADSRGRSEAQRLATNIAVDPEATIFSRDRLAIDPFAQGSGATGVRKPCPILTVTKYPEGAYRYRYSGFTLLIRTGGKFFLTPTPPGGIWDPRNDAIFVIPDAPTIRIQLMRGRAYSTKQTESTFSGNSLPFTC